MTLLFNRPPAIGPATHAFVIGVGGYPFAKAEAGNLPDLIAPEIPSAADSAKYFCDWLIRNRDTLVDPLATLEVLISDSGDGEERYEWGQTLPDGQALPNPIDAATSINVQTAGRAWLHADRVRDGDTVLLYFCGHGASLSSEPAVFLGDLNEDNTPWKFMNMMSLGRSLKQNARIGKAYLFVDACGEKIAGFDLHILANRDPGVTFWDPVKWGAAEAWKVLLYCATPSGVLAHDGEMPGSNIRLGRFTQTLVRALDGALVADWNGRWAVDSANLTSQLKKLREFSFPGWSDHPFDPGPLMPFNEIVHIVVPSKPTVPIQARVSPRDALNGHLFCIGDAPPPPLPVNNDIELDDVANVWRAELPPSGNLCYAIAYTGQACHVRHFTPDKPHFDLQIPIT